ncbi:MAG TPA: LacI family DNA-binding transcriptional regulator, partial [Opitutales bacterium]|nr:LacI family DNA-binding transcriptional regulator [Opitutales bacterium]
ETIARVRVHATKLNYRPHAGASSIRSRHFSNVGFMVSNSQVNNLESIAMHYGIHDAALEYNFRLTMIRQGSTSCRNPDAISRVFNESHLDALILLDCSGLNENYQKILELTDFPVVFLDHKQDFQSVYCNDVAGARAATEHLLSQGYRKIAFFRTKNAGNLEPHYSFTDRYQGYADAMRNARQEPAQAWVMSDHGDEATQNWLFGSNRPEAIVCYSDMDANVIGRLAYQGGLRIPDDLAITGYGDEASAASSWVPLTSVSIPYYQMAQTAFQKALEQMNRMEAPEPFASVALEPTLQVRASSQGSPKGARVAAAAHN